MVFDSLFIIEMIIFSTAFVFINVSNLEGVYYTFMSVIDKPREIYNKYLTFGLLFMVPLIPIANTSTSILLNKGSSYII